MSDKNQQAIEIYNAIAHNYAQTFDSVDSEEDLRFPNTFASYLTPGSSVLDLGCGTGYTVNLLNTKGMRATGVDLSDEMIAIAKKQYPNTTFTVADMRTYQPTESFDAVWAGYSLFHFEQDSLEQTLRAIHRYLVPGGIFGLVVQKGTGEVEINAPFLPEKQLYIHLYTLEILTTTLARRGFEIITSDVKQPKDYELPYDKLLVIARRTQK